MDELGTGTEPPLVVIIGATAVGKSALSLEIAERFGAEIIGADSRQIYRGMDIGTAKPTPGEQKLVPHHLIDLCAPDSTLTLAEYQRLAHAAIADIHARGHLPLMVGGTVLYVRAVVEGLRIPVAPPDPVLRAELEDLLAREVSRRAVCTLAGSGSRHGCGHRRAEPTPGAARTGDLLDDRHA